jgi:hypothetical protein
LTDDEVQMLGHLLKPLNDEPDISRAISCDTRKLTKLIVVLSQLPKGNSCALEIMLTMLNLQNSPGRFCRARIICWTPA